MRQEEVLVADTHYVKDVDSPCSRPLGQRSFREYTPEREKRKQRRMTLNVLVFLRLSLHIYPFRDDQMQYLYRFRESTR